MIIISRNTIGPAYHITELILFIEGKVSRMLVASTYQDWSQGEPEKYSRINDWICYTL